MKKIFHELVTVEAVQSRRGGFAKTLGIEFTEVGADYIRASMKVTELHLRGGGILNGGVSLGMIETVGSTAAGAAVALQKLETLGIQVSANHLRTARAGDVLTATAKAKHVGRKMHVWDVEIENQDQKPVCTGSITMMIVEALPTT